MRMTAILTLLVSLQLPAQTPSPGSIVGTVTDDQNKPVGGATVTINRVFGRKEPVTPFNRTVKAASDGSFQAYGLDPGTYTWCAQAEVEGYVNHCHFGPPPLPITVATGQKVRTIIRISTGSILKVRVVDPGGKGMKSSVNHRDLPMLLGVSDIHGHLVPVHFSGTTGAVLEYHLTVPFDMLQLDPPATAAGIWDWRQNILDWQTKFALQAGPERDTTSELPPGTKEARAYPFWFRQVNQWKSYNENNTPQVAWPGDPGPNVSPNCSFQAPSSSADPVRTTTPPYWYGDAILMKQIAGAPNGNYVVWDNINSSPPQWVFHKDNNINCDIVYEFCTCTNPNPRNCVQVSKTQCGLP